MYFEGGLFYFLANFALNKMYYFLSGVVLTKPLMLKFTLQKSTEIMSFSSALEDMGGQNSEEKIMSWK